MPKILGLKSLDAKISTASDAVTEVRASAHQVGRAAESQATLNMVLSAAVLVAMLGVLVVLAGRDS